MDEEALDFARATYEKHLIEQFKLEYPTISSMFDDFKFVDTVGPNMTFECMRKGKPIVRIYHDPLKDKFVLDIDFKKGPMINV